MRPLPFRLLSLTYLALATTAMIWLLLQGDWTPATAGITGMFAFYGMLTIAAAFHLVQPAQRAPSSPDLRLTIAQQKTLHMAAILLPLPVVAFFAFFWYAYLTMDQPQTNERLAPLCIALGETLTGRSAGQELANQLATRASILGEEAELKKDYGKAEAMYRLQDRYQWLSGIETGPAAQAGLIASAAMCDRQGKGHEADLLYALAETKMSCRYTNKDRSVNVIAGPHLLKLLRDVPNDKLPEQWYLSSAVKDLRKATGAQASLICCPFDFIVEHDCSHLARLPKLARIRDAENAWLRRDMRSLRSSAMVEVTANSREFTTKVLNNYLRRIEPKVAAENLAFYDEFEKFSNSEIDEKTLPNKRECTVGFPYSARQLAPHRVWRISERDYMGLMLLSKETPQPQLMCVDDTASSMRTY